LAIDFVHHYQGRSALIYQELQERTDALVEKAAIQLAAAEQKAYSMDFQFTNAFQAIVRLL
jgi:hypothetical protein